MGKISERTNTYLSPDGLTIFYRQFQALNEKARLIISHGLGEHSGRYENVINHFVPYGHSIWIADHRGHGKSGGKRGHVQRFGQYVQDLNQIVGLAREDLPNQRKVFLLGHSMGGLIALAFAQKVSNQIDGVITSSPALGAAYKLPLIQKIVGRIMSIVWPGLLLPNELDATKISRDKKVVDAYLNDPLVHDRVSARWFTEMVATMNKVNRHAKKISIPILMQVAGDDQIVSNESSRRFFDQVSSVDKTLHVYDDLYHEIYIEITVGRKKVLDDVAFWLEKRL